MPNKIRQHYQLFQEEFQSKLKAFNSLSEAPDQYHSFLDFTKDYRSPQIVIRIKRNETLIEKMKQIRAKNPQLKRPNVLLLMIDSLSRPHFFRKMPKTAEYLEIFFNEKNQKQKMKGYQFFRFHSLRQHHMANLLALRYDDREFWEAIHHWERFENNFKDEGYITATASAKCEIDELDISRNYKSKKYADRRPLDYEFFAASCDPNATPSNQSYSYLKGPFSEFRRCVYSKDSFQHQFDFTYNFWKTYQDQPKVQMVTLMDGHEFTGELPVYLDQYLPNFLEKMKNEGLLENSLVFIMSDHGNNANLFFKGTTSGRNELANPFFALLMSQNNVERFDKSAKVNQQRLISFHDVNRVLNELVGVKKEYKGMNFLLREVEESRTCGDAMIPPRFCRCIHGKKIKRMHEKNLKKHYGNNQKN